MTRQKRIIELLEGIINSNVLTEEAIEDNKYIVECVRKHTPMKPKGDGTYKWCPNCEEIEFGYNKPRYCHNCGQLISWEE